jgi:hypothetical protein
MYASSGEPFARVILLRALLTFVHRNKVARHVLGEGLRGSAWSAAFVRCSWFVWNKSLGTGFMV